MSFLRAINLFPWDAADEGAERCMETIASLGCNGVTLSPNYHRARLFRPRMPDFYNRPVDWCDFPPDEAAYAEPGLLPPVNPDARCVAASEAAARAARARGLTLTVAVIGCHNTTIGLKQPDLCMESAMGDRYAFALCPAQPRVRAYLASLVRDIARRFRPDALLLDSFSYLDAVHREHHELMFISPGEFGKFLLSLCFCPACVAEMQQAGVDAGRMRSQVQTLVRASLARGCEPRLALPERDEFTGLLMEFPELLEVVRVRAEVVTGLLGAAGRAAQEEGVAVHCQSGLLARPTARAWTEGAGLRARAEHCERIFLQAHWPSARESIQDLTWAATVLPAGRLVHTTMCSEDNIPSEGDLVQRAVAARRIGAAGISYYNYGLLSPERLEWIRSANKATL
jgi:hypothetical protein